MIRSRSRPELGESVRVLPCRVLAELPHRARRVAGIGANQQPSVGGPGQADPTQPIRGFVKGDPFTGMYLPPVGLLDDSAVAHGTDLLPVRLQGPVSQNPLGFFKVVRFIAYKVLKLHRESLVAVRLRFLRSRRVRPHGLSLGHYHSFEHRAVAVW